MSLGQFIRLNTVFLPSEELLKIALDLAAEITCDKESLFHIDNRNYFAHLTIYAPEYPSKNLEQIIGYINDLSGDLPKIELVFQSFYVGGGYVGINFLKTDEITTIHEKILERLNPLRDGHIREKYQAGISANKYPPEQTAYIQRFGYHLVQSEFHPHLTLARFQVREQAEKVALELNRNVKISSTVVSKLAICEMGLNGTCTKILQEFPLAGEPS